MGNPSSFDEKITVRNVTFTLLSLKTGQISFYEDSDGFLVHLFVSVISFILGGQNHIYLAIYIWIQFTTVILFYASKELLNQFNFEYESKFLALSLILFFDWILFPTTDFRSEGLALSILIYQISLFIKIQKERFPNFTLFFWFLFLNIILMFTHFLSFFFYSLFIISFVSWSDILSKNSGYFKWETRMWILFQNILVLFFYDNLFSNQSFQLSIILDLTNRNRILVVIKLIYLTFWIILTITPFLKNFNSYLIKLIKVHRKYSKSTISGFDILQLQQIIFILIFPIILVSVILNLYQSDFEVKGFYILLFNIWKLALIILIIYYLFSQSIIEDINEFLASDNYFIIFLILASIELIFFGIPYSFVIHNVHLRMAPILFISTLIFILPKIDKLKNENKLSFTFLLFLWFGLNIINGSAFLNIM